MMNSATRKKTTIRFLALSLNPICEVAFSRSLAGAANEGFGAQAVLASFLPSLRGLQLAPGIPIILPASGTYLSMKSKGAYLYCF